MSVSLILRLSVIFSALLLYSCVGGSSKTLMIVNLCPNKSNLTETLASLNFAARARHATLGHGDRDTIKKWVDVVSPALYHFLSRTDCK